MTDIDLKDPSPMNRFHGMDSKKTALEVVRRMIAGETFPEVTLWRLHGYIECWQEVGAKFRHERESVRRALTLLAEQTDPSDYATGDNIRAWRDAKYPEVAD